MVDVKDFCCFSPPVLGSKYFQINCSFFLAIFLPAEKPGYHYLSCVLNLKQIEDNLYETKKPVLNVQMIFCIEWLQKWTVEFLNSKTLS